MEKVKTIRPRNWLYEWIVIAEEVIIFAIWLMILKSWPHAVIMGGLTYLTLAWTLRLTLQRHHRKGMKYLQQGNYEAASKAFESSYTFFTTHSWIDRYRFITMFYSNAVPFRQMALNNLGLCYLYMNEGAKALEVFQKLAEINPDYQNITRAINELQTHIAETD
jgi:tetratricopeptide (TPR) repeat protein